MQFWTRKHEKSQYNLVRDSAEEGERQLSTADLLTPDKAAWCRKSVFAVLGAAFAALLCGYWAGRYSSNYQINNDLGGLRYL